ncbi:MAG: hypothetical protein EOM91_15545 [Sphingobacteriia bacterium]|nr:hypothetical protein [Sphingobacteriia bacterium]
MADQEANREKQRRFRERMRSEGMTTETIWIPSEARALVRSIARMLRETAPQRRAKEEAKKGKTK